MITKLTSGLNGVHELRVDDGDAIAWLKLVAFEERRVSPSSQLGVSSGSWSSPKRAPDQAMKEIVIAALEEAGGSGNWEVEAWFNEVDAGGSVGAHDHRDGRNEWSGVLYLSGGSRIHFVDLGLRYRPEPGLMLLWPSEVRHKVELEPKGGRISIAFNARRGKEKMTQQRCGCGETEELQARGSDGLLRKIRDGLPGDEVLCRRCSELLGREVLDVSTHDQPARFVYGRASFGSGG